MATTGMSMRNAANSIFTGLLLSGLMGLLSMGADKRDGTMLTGFHPRLTERPRLGAKPGDRRKMQEAIRNGGDLKGKYIRLRDKLAPYIKQHGDDPDHLMSRMPMHWGKHYTIFPAFGEKKSMEFSDFDSPYKPAAPCVMNSWRGGSLDMRKRSGHAPVPTMRVGFGGVKTTRGNGYRTPKLGTIEAYNGDLFQVRDAFHKEVENYLPLSGTAICDYYKPIIGLATEAAMLYYWTEDERYARFACDYLMQWVLGIYFQNPYNRPKAAVDGKIIQNTSTGVNGMDISAGYMKQFAWVYDFCFDYLREKERHYLDGAFYPHREGEVDHAGLKEALRGKTIVEVVDQAFFKFCYHMILEDVLVGNPQCPNNHCIWSQQSVDFLLAIEDHELRAKGMDVIVYSDELCRPTQWGHYGSLSVNTTVANAFTDDGFWKESTVYQMIATGRVIGLLRSLDRAGYQPWEANGRVFRSACAPFRLMFPHRYLASYGDANNMGFTRTNVDFMYRTAKAHDMPEAKQLGKQLRWAIDRGFNRPLHAEEMEDVPAVGEGEMVFTRTDRIDFIPLYVQRNKGLDRDNGLMSTLYCGNYTHCLPEGINFEFYAKGLKVVPHVGYYPYGSKPHNGWCQKIGSKNTVIPGDIPLTMRDMSTGKYDLTTYAMEPAPQQDAVSPDMSFIEVELPYGGRQRRCMALIRTSASTGFLVDVFRSSNEKSNEYRLHSVGQGVAVYDHDGGTALPFASTTDLANAKLGDDYLEDKLKCPRAIEGNLRAVLDIADDKGRPGLEFSVFLAGRTDYTVYTATGLQRKAADRPFDKMRAPMLAVRLPGEAWDRPFATVYEAAKKGTSAIQTVTRLADGSLTVLEITGANGTHHILSAVSPDQPHQLGTLRFQGTFATVAKIGTHTELYLGKGVELTDGTHAIQSLDGTELSVSLRIVDGGATISATAPCRVTVADKTTTVQPGLNQKL